MKQRRSDAEPDGLSEEVASLPALGPERLKVVAGSISAVG